MSGLSRKRGDTAQAGPGVSSPTAQVAKHPAAGAAADQAWSMRRPVPRPQAASSPVLRAEGPPGHAGERTGPGTRFRANFEGVDLRGSGLELA